MQTLTQSEYLTILSHAPAAAVKALAEAVIPRLGDILVLQSRTGLVMLPAIDSAQGTVFHLGEILTSEAHVRISGGVEGYGMCLGRDLEQAMAMALLDAALTARIEADPIEAFLRAQSEAQQQADETLLRQVQATRVEMETF
ncbi:MAG TPA: phosphonate C-P lyase system protein PhnG [Phototrophicaceae bacterium]|nr:phosphonate C-P lyase system protein PhnG [Phototrophicaceae bacterium]